MAAQYAPGPAALGEWVGSEPPGPHWRPTRQAAPGGAAAHPHSSATSLPFSPQAFKAPFLPLAGSRLQPFQPAGAAPRPAAGRRRVLPVVAAKKGGKSGGNKKGPGSLMDIPKAKPQGPSKTAEKPWLDTNVRWRREGRECVGVTVATWWDGNACWRLMVHGS